MTAMTTTRAWEAFQQTDRAPRGVSDDVVQSWRRSKWNGVDPDKAEARFVDVALDSPFIRAAVPVMLKTAELLTGSTACLALADPNGTILWRWVSDPGLARVISRHHLEQRFVFSEEQIGTNGVGTALESKKVATVLGAAHFVRAFHELACVAAPVFHPVTRRVCGVVNITCRASEANQFLQVAIRSMAADVRSELHSAASVGQKRLLEAYLHRRARTLAPLVAVNDKIVISDELSLEHDSLWQRVLAVTPATRFVEIEPRATGGLMARLWPVTAGTFDDGVVLEVDTLAGKHEDLSPSPSAAESLDLSPLDRAERAVILESLARHGGNKSHAAEDLRISRRSLYDKLHRYGIRT